MEYTIYFNQYLAEGADGVYKVTRYVPVAGPDIPTQQALYGSFGKHNVIHLTVVATDKTGETTLELVGPGERLEDWRY